MAQVHVPSSGAIIKGSDGIAQFLAPHNITYEFAGYEPLCFGPTYAPTRRVSSAINS